MRRIPRPGLKGSRPGASVRPQSFAQEQSWGGVSAGTRLLEDPRTGLPAIYCENDSEVNASQRKSRSVYRRSLP